ncbi:MAG: UDP-N-acetylmuramate--L-alanine ligase [Bacteroidetes bacterium]|nr:UDP-N-acetylmuramate--L-alanine ligase [Bacteroidota bacterium]
MNINDIKTAYFIGIGGIGMSALARYFHSAGITVSGYDRSRSVVAQTLENEGINIFYTEDITHIPKKVDLVVYTPAIPSSHAELTHCRNENITLQKRSEVLGWITKDKFLIAIAGTHGKTSITTLIAHILQSSGKNCTALLGGISLNYNSNFVPGSDNIFVIEADEYDRSFLTLSPDISVITAMDADHFDVYGDQDTLNKAFFEFASNTKAGGKLVLNSKVAGIPEFSSIKDRRTFTYSVSENADFSSEGISINLEAGAPSYRFDMYGAFGLIRDLSSTVPGDHSVENCLAAIAVSQLLAVSGEDIRSALSTFKGIKRRFEFQLQDPSLVYIDDYAHHPKEIAVTLDTAKKLYPDNKISVVFQPHLYSRTRDLYKAFGESLSKADSVILLDIYPAREAPIEGVSSEMILSEVRTADKILTSKDQLTGVLENKNIEVLLTLGAGDIDEMVEPIKDLFRKRLTKR